MKIKIQIYILLWITIKVLSEKNVITSDLKENDSVVIEAAYIPADRSSRKSRHITNARASWLDALAEGNSCLSSNGLLGKCLSLRNCYPYIREPSPALVFNSWFIGNYDPCSYFSKNGQQHLGICCTNTQTAVKPDDEIDNLNNHIEVDDKKIGGTISQWPPQVPTHATKGTRAPATTMQWPPQAPTHATKGTRAPATTMQWPPQAPTHPPNHTAPTHPPSNDHFGTTSTTRPWWSTTTTTTKRPWTTTTTSKPWWTTTTTSTTTRPWWETTTTTKRPVPVWPPPVPTHPTHPPTQHPQMPEFEETERPGGDHFQNVCGAKNGALDQERIVGGQNASPNEWPWVVVLFNNGRQFCGGSLIDSVHILSAAHCVAQMSSWDVARLTAHLGDHDIRNPNEVRHLTRRIKRVVRHRGFEFSTLHNDVAVLTLDEPVTFSRTISPVCLPSVASAKNYRGQLATVAGWGSLRENGPQPSVLQKVTLPIWSNADCARKYGGAAPAGITASMLCAGQAAKDSCSGDSGGPLMLNEGGGRWTQVGIVSWGIGCGKGQYPGVYTRVSSFMPWITKNLN